MAAKDDTKRVAEPFTVGASLAIGGADQSASLAALAELVKESTAEADKFYAIESDGVSDFVFDRGILTFRSAIVTETKPNNIVHAKVYEGGSRRSAVVVLPHWNVETGGYDALNRRLTRLGLTVVELTLPYHGLRSRPGSVYSDYFVSSNIGRTIRSVRQAVLDTRKTITWLSDRGYRNIALIGVSMGSCIAGLVAAHDARICTSALLLTAGDFSEVIWTSRATRYIKNVLAAATTLDELKRVWSIISPGTFAKELSRMGHRVLMISGSSKPLLPEVGASMIAVDTLVHNFLQRTGILHRLSANHPYGAACYRPTGCADIIRTVSTRIDARRFNRTFPQAFPRFVQLAIWRYCAQGYLNICNGNRIDDRHACQNWHCQLYPQCDRKPLM